MGGEDSDGLDSDGYIPEDPHFFPKFDFDDENDSDNFGFSNILHPDQYDAGDLVGEANPNENYFDGSYLGYLPKSPDFFIDINSDMETEVNNDEFHELLQPNEHGTSTLVENAANPNENHFDEHDVAYVPQDPVFPQQIIHTHQGIAPFVFEFSHPEEHDDADTLIENANISENYTHGHDVENFPENIDYLSHEHIIEEHHVEGNMIGNFATSEQHESENDYSRGNRTEKWPGWPGQNVFRLLVPVKKVGCIIGPKGEYIKKTTEETKARIKVLGGQPGITERAVLISAREVPHCTVPPAVKGLLRVHEQVLNDTVSITSGAVCSITTRLLVPDTQGRSLIGKQGLMIRSIQENTGCIIRVLRSGSRPVFALKDDSVVEIHGESGGVHKAVELIALHLRQYLVDHSIIGVFEEQASL
ncbi:putative K domain-containing protein [Lupinus albus]|uniref:Putative K domain-containing protein n=1 Tax=Lupinus albus TaxID=3870 RepID=A0A6A4R9Z6_LUPAL|nr:putative K domain-containing protein [Lupinus albus]